MSSIDSSDFVYVDDNAEGRVDIRIDLDDRRSVFSSSNVALLSSDKIPGSI